MSRRRSAPRFAPRLAEPAAAGAPVPSASSRLVALPPVRLKLRLSARRVEEARRKGAERAPNARLKEKSRRSLSGRISQEEGGPL